MLVRFAEVGEVGSVVELYRAYNRPPDPEIELSDLQRRFEDIHRSGYLAVAVDNGAIVGTYCMYFCPGLARSGRPFAIIEHVIVSPRMRRRGVGRALMAHAQMKARENNCYKVMLATGAKRPENLAFYEACGFVGDKVGFQVRYDA